MLSLPRARRTRAALALGAGLALASPASAQFATTVVDFHQGPGGGLFDTDAILGGPQGGGFSVGSIDVLSLGTGGDVTLGFDVTITDGPGADLIAFENGFADGSGEVFSEVAFVEVSTDGATFARFPTSYDGPAGPLPAFGTTPIGTFRGLVGGSPVIANVLSNPISPFDPVESGGEAFDLADLAGHPAVAAGTVDLSAIHFVRIVDAPEGAEVDSNGVTIWDNGGPGGSADLDAVAVVNHTGNVTPDQPVVDLELDAQGFAHLRLGDPDGFFDLDFATLRVGFSLVELSFLDLVPLFAPVSVTPEVVEFRSTIPFDGIGLQFSFAVSAQDLDGGFAGDQLFVQS